MKNSFNYSKGIANIDIDGLPDFSISQDSNSISIILSWKLNLIGLATLEGKKEHLIDLLYVIKSYSNKFIYDRDILTSVSTEYVSITYSKDYHNLKLVSSKKDVKPLSLKLDDADFIDLTLCLDKIYDDSRLLINWKTNNFKLKKTNNLLISNKNESSLASILLGTFLVLISSISFINLSKIDLSEPIIYDTNKESLFID
ncbi:DUF4335 domain-containing protein [Prochlorococcus marinus]|uniref:DUF4335 domain-containing protein n=1 Tax=Prochlorococcus marinus TaxID=1219 RepID=UPI0022B44FF6|nr:DUF4335 domain-containing protein [Prochlorococcus marinus]